MTRKSVLFALILTMLTGYAAAQTTQSRRDSVARKAIIFFPQGQSSYVERSEYRTIMPFIEWAQENPHIAIRVTGWSDKSGSQERNIELSQLRADVTRDFLLKNGISADRIIAVEGRGVHQNSKSDFAARRVELRGVVRNDYPPTPEPEIVLSATAATQSAPIQAEEPETIMEIVTPPAPATEEPAVAAETAPGTELKPSNSLTRGRPAGRWYVGLEGGVSFGLSTFTSFSAGGAGWTVGAMGGHRISPLLSVELGFNAGGVRLGATECCVDYFLGTDGERYLTNATDVASYSYDDIYSSVSVQQLALRLNIDLLQIAKPNWGRNWSFIVTPAIYGIATTASIKQRDTDKTVIDQNSLFQFGVGIGLGSAYQITPNFGVGLRSSMVWVFGNKRFDGISTTDHRDNMLWNNTVTLTWRFISRK